MNVEFHIMESVFADTMAKTQNEDERRFLLLFIADSEEAALAWVEKELKKSTGHRDFTIVKVYTNRPPE